jgi:uncharacterized phage-associated protein
MLRERKTTQVAAHLLSRAGGHMSYLRLLKLLYIADRQSIAKWGTPITLDSDYSMKFGPVLSETYNAIKGEIQPPIWSAYIRRVADSYAVELVADPGDGELSDAEVELLDSVHDSHREESQWDIVKKLHEECPEWVDPGNSSEPIDFEDILDALQIFGERRDTILADYRETRRYYSSVMRAEHA